MIASGFGALVWLVGIIAWMSVFTMNRLVENLMWRMQRLFFLQYLKKIIFIKGGVGRSG